LNAISHSTTIKKN